MDLKGTLGVRVRRALLRVPALFHEARRGAYADLRCYQNRRNSTAFEEITKVAVGDRGNHRPSAIYRLVRQFATVLVRFERRNFCIPATQHRSNIYVMRKRIESTSAINQICVFGIISDLRTRVLLRFTEAFLHRR